MTVVILEIKSLVVFSRAVVNLHLPDPAPGDAVLSAVAAEQRTETRRSTWSVSRVCPAKFRDDGKNKRRTRQSTVVHSRPHAPRLD